MRIRVVEKLWDYIWECLFYPETSLIYDLRTTIQKDGNIIDLPTIDEISRNYPNACGWNTGMENSMINGGIMLDTIIERYNKTGDKSMISYADKIFAGIKLCSEISGSPGFLARSVSPFDKKSFYMNSSRDQYTHVISALVHYYDSDLCAEKEKVAEILVSFAERAYKNATKENGYDLLRADGKQSLVCRVWGDIIGHEFLRLPMFYMAAYHVSNDEKWLILYKELRDEALANSYDFCDKDSGFFAYLQMQISIRILYELDDNYKEKYKDLMTKVADKKAHVILDLLKETKEKNLDFSTLPKPWRTFPVGEQLTVDGNEYIMLDRNEDFQNSVMFFLQDVADLLIVQNLCPDYKTPHKYKDAFFEIIEHIDVENHASEAPIHLVCAYWGMK